MSKIQPDTHDSVQAALWALYDHSGGTWRDVAKALGIAHVAQVWRMANGKGYSDAVIQALYEKGYLSAGTGDLIAAGVRLTEDQWRYVETLGNGNCSLGVRILIEKERHAL